MRQPDTTTRLRHMLDAAREARGFAAGRSRADLDTDRGLGLILTRLLEITGDEPHLIPGLGPLRREQPLEHLDDLAQGRRIGGGGARRGSG